MAQEHFAGSAQKKSLKEPRGHTLSDFFIPEPDVRVELTTVRLQIGCSTTELIRRGARILPEKERCGKLFFEEELILW